MCVDETLLLNRSSQIDLSKRVAASWRSCDDEVKLYCAEVSDLLTQAYKRAVYFQAKGIVKNEAGNLSAVSWRSKSAEDFNTSEEIQRTREGHSNTLA